MEATAEPPVILVSTWIQMMLSDGNDDAKKRAQEMLLKTFGDMQQVALYAKKHNITIKR